MKKNSLISFLLVLSFNLFAQYNKHKWGVINPQHLAMKEYALDSSAEALVLLDAGEWLVNESFTYTLHVHRQIKIFKKDAFKTYANLSLTFRPGISDGEEYIWNFDAIVHHTDGTREELVKDKIIDERLDKDYSMMKYSFTGLREGDIIEYAYTKRSKNISFIGPWYFQESVPILHSEISFVSSEKLEYQFIYSGYLTPKQVPYKNTFGGIMLSLDTIPALKDDEVFITTPKDYCASVSFQLSRYLNSYGQVNTHLDTWEHLAKILEDDFNFGQLYQKKRFYKDIWKAVEPELEKATTEAEKMSIIYNFVNHRIQWDEDFDIGCYITLEEVFKKGKGSSAAINLTLIALLREAGIKAYPMLVSTREHGKTIEVFPLIRQFNHVLCLVETADNKKVILDGGNKYRNIGMPRSIVLNRRGWIVNGKDSKWEDVPCNPLFHAINYSTLTLDEEGTMSGNITISYQHYAAIEPRTESTQNTFDEGLKKSLTTLFPDILIDSIKTSGIEDLKSPVKKVIYCKIPNFAMVNGDLIYLKPTLISKFSENPFKSKERYFPVDMPYAMKEQNILNLNLPKGFKVETMPKSTILTLLTSAGKMQYTMSENDGKIQMNLNVNLTQVSYNPQEYPYLKEFYGNIVAKLEEQIILKRN